MSLSGEDLSYILGVLGVGGIVFTIYNSFRTPQITSDKTTAKLQEDIEHLKLVVSEIKEKHLQAVENDLKKLSDSIQGLSLTVVKLSTIIDERMPRIKVTKK